MNAREYLERPEAIARQIRLIARLPNDEMARILERRYLDKWPWDEIIDEMDKTPSLVYSLHRTALSILSPAPDPEEEIPE